MEIHFILVFMIAAAVMAVEIKDLLSSVIALSAVGLGLSLAFLVLKAPNLAITQLVVEIICVIILIRATIKKDLPLVRDGRWFFNTVSTFLFIGCFLFIAFYVLNELPVFGQPLMRVSGDYIAAAAKQGESLNLVAALSGGARRLDSLTEAAILFTGLVGVLAITRKVGKIHGKK